MWTQSKAKSLDLHSHAMTEFKAAAEAWDIGDAFACDTFADDGNSISPSDGPCPPHVGRDASRGPVAWEAREKILRGTIATILLVAIAAFIPACGPAAGPRHEPLAGPRPSAMGVAAASTSPALGPVGGTGLAASDVASRYHRRDLLQGMND